MKFSHETKQPRKKRLAAYRAPLHLRRKTVHANLSKDLRKKLGTRSAAVKKGDTVKIVRGDHAKITGKVLEVDVAQGRVYVEKVIQKKHKGKERFVPIEPSNVMIIETERSAAKAKAAPEQKTETKKA
ncbi:MAG: 50S ribosomal protein L24 [Candidatus Micrarchaeia archaeon]|jgi:large subunit ribosomal protein L24